MQRNIFGYGAMAGIVIIGTTIASLELGSNHQWLGFLVMFIAFSSIFFAIKQYRDNTLGGVINFNLALLMGVGISAVAAVIYVFVWEIYLASTDYSFIKDYSQAVIAERKSAGVSDAELKLVIAETDKIVAQYNDPWVRLPMTLLEIFPVGLLVSFISALILRNHKSPLQTNG